LIVVSVPHPEDMHGIGMELGMIKKSTLAAV